MIVKTFRVSKNQQQDETKNKYKLIDNQQFLLLPIGDVHYGAPHFPQEKFVKHLKWGMEAGGYFLGMGDYMDFTSESQRKIVMPLREETKKFIDEMVMTKVREFLDIISFTKGRWLGFIEGHHYWIMENGLSSDQVLAREMETDFLGVNCLLTILPPQNNKHMATASVGIYAHHGVGAYRTEGAHLNRLVDQLRTVNADVYIMGHTHAKMADTFDVMERCPDGTLYRRNKTILRTGGWLSAYDNVVDIKNMPSDATHDKYLTSYVERKAYPPSTLGAPAIAIAYEKIPGTEYWKPIIHSAI